MSIDEVTDTIKDTVGSKKGLFVIGGLGVGLVLLSLASKSGDSGTVNVTSYSSYPDVDRNADVIISSLQNSIDFQTEQLNTSLDLQTGVLSGQLSDSTGTLLLSDTMTQGVISNGFQEQKDYMSNQFQVQKEYLSNQFQVQHDLISDGFETQQFLLHNMHEDTMNGIDLLNSNMSNYSQDILNTVRHEAAANRVTLMNGIDGVMSSMDAHYGSLNDSINTVSSQIEHVYQDVKIYEQKETPSVSVGNNTTNSRPLSNPEINALTDFLKGDSDTNYSTNPVSKGNITPSTSTNLVGIGKKVG